MEQLKHRFMQLNGLEEFQRVDENHPLAWYIGINESGNYSLFCITDKPKEKIKSSNCIRVFIGQRRDGKTGITFSLTDKKVFDLFIYFCFDMIEITRPIKGKGKIADFICSRFNTWQKAFERVTKEMLSFSEIKGLIGELVFLYNKMIPQYGQEKALASWTGFEMTDRDFTCGETWYEIKTAVSGATEVKISSIEQLDAQEIGHLVIIFLDKTSESDSSRITLNSIFKLIYNKLSTQLLKDRFKTILLRFGYMEREEYNHICFKLSGITMYKVDRYFPCIRQGDVPIAAQHVKYSLSLSAIDSYKE